MSACARPSFIAAMILLLAVAATAQTNNSSNAVPFLGDIPQFHLTTNKLSDAEIQGRELVSKILQLSPKENYIQIGVLKISDQKGVAVNVPLKLITTISENGWHVDYIAGSSNSFGFTIFHENGNTNKYVQFFIKGDKGINFNLRFNGLVESRNVNADLPFANSDFWICDLGLEFFYWPEQKIIKKEFARGRGCMVLESTNPNPLPNGYSRVDCWIDEETLGIVQAKAYDASGKLLKEFEPKSFKKVNGQWELQDMEIRNVQTGSRTRIEFDLNPKS